MKGAAVYMVFARLCLFDSLTPIGYFHRVSALSQGLDLGADFNMNFGNIFSINISISININISLQARPKPKGPCFVYPTTPAEVMRYPKPRCLSRASVGSGVRR